MSLIPPASICISTHRPSSQNGRKLRPDETSKKLVWVKVRGVQKNLEPTPWARLTEAPLVLLGSIALWHDLRASDCGPNSKHMFQHPPPLNLSGLQDACGVRYPGAATRQTLQPNIKPTQQRQQGSTSQQGSPETLQPRHAALKQCQ
jgi:hypothetical protein